MLRAGLPMLVVCVLLVLFMLSNRLSLLLVLSNRLSRLGEAHPPSHSDVDSTDTLNCLVAADEENSVRVTLVEAPTGMGHGAVGLLAPRAESSSDASSGLLSKLGEVEVAILSRAVLSSCNSCTRQSEHLSWPRASWMYANRCALQVSRASIGMELRRRFSSSAFISAAFASSASFWGLDVALGVSAGDPSASDWTLPCFIEKHDGFPPLALSARMEPFGGAAPNFCCVAQASRAVFLARRTASRVGLEDGSSPIEETDGWLSGNDPSLDKLKASGLKNFPSRASGSISSESFESERDELG
mmetsp:Transcript_9404/g.19448  ORF Transcript_9404/g.19448 Transcript_9404/m.19448 type:complete len:301 (-) Transcript_9404:654-1556(-)